jgi:hypothetical protein
MTPDTCPNCGADVPTRAKACPECGACEETGWSDDAKLDALGLPDDSFDYDEYAKRDFGKGGKKAGRSRLKPIWWIAAIIILIVMLLLVR